MRTEGVAVATASQSGGLWSMPVMPSPAHKQKIVRVFFQKRAIELQTAVNATQHAYFTLDRRLGPHHEAGLGVNEERHKSSETLRNPPRRRSPRLPSYLQHDDSVHSYVCPTSKCHGFPVPRKTRCSIGITFTNTRYRPHGFQVRIGC